jgi:hypothetical protein
MTEIFHQEAGRRAQTWRFAPDRLMLARADATGAAEIALAYCDIDIDAAATIAPRGPPWRRQPGATRFPVVAGRRQGEALEVWRDAHHDSIVAELAARWKASRRALVRVDFSADPGREMQRFEALMRRGIVSAEECAAAIARIAASASQ